MLPGLLFHCFCECSCFKLKCQKIQFCAANVIEFSLITKNSFFFFFYTSIYKDSQFNNTKIKNSKIQVQNKTQTLRKPYTFLNRVCTRRGHININNNNNDNNNDNNNTYIYKKIKNLKKRKEREREEEKKAIEAQRDSMKNSRLLNEENAVKLRKLLSIR